MQKIKLSDAIYDPGANPLQYPSKIVEQPVLLSDGSFEYLHPSDDFLSFFDKNGEDLNIYLEKRGSAPVADRIAQVAFGAHRNIENIAWKFAHYNTSVKDKVSDDFIIIPGYIQNADVVACNLSSGGHIYSGLLTTREGLGIREYLLGTRCPVAILLLDQRQMEAMHIMGGLNKEGDAPSAIACDLADIQVYLSESTSCMAQTYSVGVPFMSLDGKPIAFEAVSTSGRANYRSMNQEKMFDEINQMLKIEDSLKNIVPIADKINFERKRIFAEGGDVGKELAQNKIFSFVKQELSSRFTLKDKDGKSRRGVEDIYPVRKPEDLWAFRPIFDPKT